MDQRNTVHLFGAEYAGKEQNLYIGLDVKGSSGEIRPRQKLLNVPSAAFAADVATAKGDFAVQGNMSVGGILTADNVIPKGGIIMWSGAEEDIPAGWALCDGKPHKNIKDNTTTKTPNLCGRFIVGYNPTDGDYAIGKTGGSRDVTLNANQVPLREHSHDYWGNRYLKLRLGDLWSLGSEDQNIVTWYEWSNSSTGVQFPNSPSHREKAYRFGTSAAGGDNGFPVEAHENRPPYYALYYIMRVK